MIDFRLNGEAVRADVPGETPLLWVVRDHFKLKGSKFGCGMALCGACTMQLDGAAIRTCVTPLSAVAGKSVRTIEGLGTPEKPHLLQKLWAEHNVPQCGYCQSGQIMQAEALLATNPDPSDADIDAAMSGNICRCGSYPRVRAAIRAAAKERRSA